MLNSARALAVMFVCLAGGGCSSVETSGSRNLLIPSYAMNISNSLRVPIESAVAGGLLFVIVDPLAPNWHIEETRLGAGRYFIALRKKRFSTGGDGEAGPAFNRRAAQIARQTGASGYRVLEFTEGIDSATLIAQRVAQGLVEIKP